MPGFKPPENFDFRQPTGWVSWKQRFSRFRLASKLNKEDGEVQVSSLIYSMGPQAEGIFSQFNLNAADSKDYEKVVEKFDEHFTPQRNVIHERAQFHKRQQREGENIEEYVRQLYELAEFAEFADKEVTIRDRLVLGVIDQDLSQKLQLEAGLTLDKAIKMARQHEQVTTQLRQQREMTSASVDAATTQGDRFSHKSSGGGRFRPSRGYRSDSSQSHSQSGQTCTRCGYLHPDRTCPAKGKQCFKCKGFNHFRGCCRSTKVLNEVQAQARETDSQVHEAGIDLPSSDEEEHFFLGSVHTDNSQHWRQTLNICGKDLSFKIDTGADVNVISKETFESLPHQPTLASSRVTLHSPGGQMKVLGRFETLTPTDRTPMTIYVIDNNTDNLLSRNSACTLGLVKRVSSVKLGTVKCDPVKIRLKEGVVPHAITVARRVPIPLKEKVEAELRRMKNENVIQEITEATEWCAGIVPVLKPNGKVRICVDLKKLNQAVRRERYVIPTVDDILHQLQGSSVFSKLDADSGFWQIPLDPESAKLTCFMTHIGRFHFTRLPFGISSAPEIFQRIMHNITKRIKGVVCYFDDILCHSATVEEHSLLLDKVKQRLHEKGLKLNNEKCEYFKSEIEFLGHVVSKDGVRPDPAKVNAIANMTPPQDVDGLRRYLGMVNYLGRFVPNLSTVLQPLNQLLVKNNTWTWGPPQVQAFINVKTLLTSAPTLAYYDPSKTTTVCADASSFGLGGVLLQEHEEGLRPVAFCSRSLTKAEQHYAQIEKECLASVWACERFERYLVGLESFTVQTDHKPLIPLMNSRDLSETPIRCQRMLTRLMRFNVHAVYTPGKDMSVADALSRSPATDGQNDQLQDDVKVHVDAVKSAWPARDAYLDRIREETKRDINLQTALEYTKTGWPEYKQDVQLAARDLFAVRGELSCVNDLLVKGDRLVIPFSMRLEVLSKIHEGHLGIVKCRERARKSVWWPRISKDIQERVAACRKCVEKQPTQRREPLLPSETPERPFQMVGVDICELKGTHYLVMSDYYSRYIDIAHLKNLTPGVTIDKMKSVFSQHGIPETVVSDNGTQFTAIQFKEFADEWNFTHVTSSPRYPQSNGQAEAAVKTAKNILKQDDISLALLVYRSTPIPSLGASPAELLFGRKLRTTLPSLPKTLKPRTVKPSTVQTLSNAAKVKQKRYYDQRHGVRHLPELSPGAPVLIKCDGEKGWKLPGRVVESCAPRSYIVESRHGSLRRNRRHLRQAPADSSPEIDQPPVFIQQFPASVPDQREFGVPQEPPDLRASREQMPTPKPSSPVQPPPQQQRGSPSVKQPSSDGEHTTTMLTPGQAYLTRSGREVKKPARFQDD